jgi:hypothetical protein
MRKLVFIAATITGLALTASAVTAPPSITLAASPLTVTYGGSTTLTGKLSTGRTGETVTIDAQECGSTAFKRLATAQTAAGGAYTYSAKPVKNTTYRSKQRSATSITVLVKVAPALGLRKIRLGRYSFSVTAAESFVGKTLAFQRLRNGRWVTLKRVTLKTVKAGTAPTQVSSASLRIRMRAGLRLRAVMPQAQVGTCYVATKSRTIRS